MCPHITPITHICTYVLETSGTLGSYISQLQVGLFSLLVRLPNSTIIFFAMVTDTMCGSGLRFTVENYKIRALSMNSFLSSDQIGKNCVQMNYGELTVLLDCYYAKYH